MSKQISKEEFILKAIERLRTEKSKGIHVVWSGLNAAFRQYFNADSKETTDAMVQKGLIEVIPFKGGPMIYLKGEAPNRVLETVNKIVG